MLTGRLRGRLHGLIRRWRGQEDFEVVPGEAFGDEVEIESLVCPLRYDIIVRTDFLAYYLGHRAVYARDLDEFMAHPAAQAYFVSWSKDTSRSRPWLAEDQNYVRREFRARMQRALKLCDSLEQSGFDNRHPIELRSAAVIRHEHDKQVSRQFYAGDGCHRIAHLLLHGHTKLAPSQYRVRVYEDFQPRDNTYLLLGSVIGTEADYCRFISRYYCAGETFETPADILRHVERHSPSQLDEVTSVMSVDLKRLAQAATEEVAPGPVGFGKQR